MEKYQSGWCGTEQHDNCRLIARNGVRAQNRYVLCVCDCHYNDSTGRDTVVTLLSSWDVPPPATHHYGDVAEFVRQINEMARPLDEDEPYGG